MAAPRRTVLIILGSILALILIAVLSIPLFLDADSFRTRIESALTNSLGRKVTLGKLDISPFSGSLIANNATIADDPAFGTQPFLQASRVRIGVEMLPLIFERQIRITRFTIDSPKITLLRAVDGRWNYSTIGGAQQNASANKESSTLIPNLIVASLSTTNGQMTVGIEPAPGTPATPRRTYDQLDLGAKDFSFQKSFPFTASAHLPGGGTVSISGNAGPIDQHDAALTPFNAHLEIKHLDLVAAGFVDSSAGLTGLINAIDTEANWNGQQLNVANLLIDNPILTIVRTNKPTTATSAPTPSSNNMLSTLTAGRLRINNGTVSITTPDQTTPAVYKQVNAEVTNVSPTASSPFKLTAQLPGGGSLSADGSAGPINQNNAAATPLNAHATLNRVDLASSGVIASDAGISGLANADVRAISDGKILNANVSANVQGLRLARNGTPSPKPVDVQLSVAQNLQALTGQLQQTVITIGKAVLNTTGTFQTSGTTTALNLQVSGQAVPIDELEAFLPSVGVHLPSGSRLQGGTLTTTLHVTGSTANPIINGPVRLDNTSLAGFDLGSKLSAITALTGAKTGSATEIRSLSVNVSINNGNIRTDNVSLVVPALGTATGAGTISASGALDYNVILKPTLLAGGGSHPSGAAGAGGLAGQLLGMIPGGAASGAVGDIAGSALRNGIPVAIGGTTSNPTFTPNLSGLATGAANSFVGSKSNSGKANSTTDPLTNALGSLLNKHK